MLFQLPNGQFPFTFLFANYIQTNKKGTYLYTGVNTCRRIQSGKFLALRVQLWRDLDRLVWLGSGPQSLKQPFTDLATTIPHCRQLCGYDTVATAVCVCVFSPYKNGGSSYVHGLISHGRRLESFDTTGMCIREISHIKGSRFSWGTSNENESQQAWLTTVQYLIKVTEINGFNI